MSPRLLLLIAAVSALATGADAAWWNGFAANGPDGRVRALAEYDGELAVGGDFANAGVTPASFIASWDGASWSAFGAGMSDDVHALTVYDGELIAAGKFDEITRLTREAVEIARKARPA